MNVLRPNRPPSNVRHSHLFPSGLISKYWWIRISSPYLVVKYIYISPINRPVSIRAGGGFSGRGRGLSRWHWCAPENRMIYHPCADDGDDRLHRTSKVRCYIWRMCRHWGVTPTQGRRNNSHILCKSAPMKDRNVNERQYMSPMQCVFLPLCAQFVGGVAGL